MLTRGQIDMKAQYHQGQLHGSYIQYKFGKLLEQRTYNMGKLDGTVRTFDERNWKIKQEVQYKNGLQDGFFRYYDENGNVTLEYVYRNGEKISGGIINK
jgi:antitoxin component YwqK of YwqJK toxin-antitoxin module